MKAPEGYVPGFGPGERSKTSVHWWNRPWRATVEETPTEEDEDA